MKEQRGLTDDQVEKEIARLTNSPLVALARKELRVKYRRRQFLYNLRTLEKRGRELVNAGITEDVLTSIENECFEEEE